MTELLSVEHLTVSFRRGTAAVDDVSLTVGRGETVGLVGESGSGKTTIGRAILGLVTASSGRIRFDGSRTGNEAASGRGHPAGRVQTVFQDPSSSLNPARTVGRSIIEPLAARGTASTASLRERTLELLPGLSACRRNRPRVTRTSSPADSGSGSRLPGRWPRRPS